MHRFRGLWVGFSWAFLGATLAACSSSDEEEPEKVCNALVNDGPEVRYVVQAGTPPTPIGGMVADGTYEMTALNLYGVTSAPTAVVRAVFEIAGTTMQQVGEIDGDEKTYTSTYTTSGTTLRVRDSCPVESLDESEFTATPTDLRYILTSEGRTLEMVLTRR
jgi:hypothetical protein